MNKIIIVLFICFISGKALSQNKSGYTWIYGADGIYAKFSGDTSRPTTGQLFPSVSFPNYPYIFMNETSNICDSATGKLLMLCNSMILYDTLGNIVENGDSLQPHHIYMHNCCPASGQATQGSLILPKGSNGLYYLFTPTITDSAYTQYVSGGSGKVPFDLLQYHIVDANSNGGLGKVIQKNIPLLSQVEMCKVGMMACRHANGYDWWLLKQALDTNMVYTFLVTADTVELKFVQGFAQPRFGYYDLVGQSCFSTDGSQYAFATGGFQSDGAHLFIADFDRCTGLLGNPKELNAPHDSSLTPLDNLFGPYFDSLITGIAFSANDSFLYVARRYTIYQYDLHEPDSSLAWSLIQQGPDTIFTQFVEYGQMQRGVDNRIYIGKSFGGSFLQNSMIDQPNLKGSACDFCKRCLRFDTCIDYSCSPPNMPDFNLGKKEPCWPLQSTEQEIGVGALTLYPNPVSASLFAECITAKNETLRFQLYNTLGQLCIQGSIRSNTQTVFHLSDLPPGLYYLRCHGHCKKIVKE